ncbi:P-loop containing nucleoside triphosphate hydrolase protein [Penicillium lagena]|uniref:P-loop containing nucleoside triphosphate hydrolase protein n=1 Tax=Penicillium lagena TaxID=94218 RepID=UPI002542596F|nr:P-loop containing nucleoside triphosphate hydrolase protein [Penicillium lagena]KAJ5625164.1 P-loop containing nucleoside triphosphate hydrolase protein [Penicillium lagena]
METTPLPFLHEIEKLKHLPRTGWLRTMQHVESVAAHSFRVAILAYLAPNDLNLDIFKCMKMGLFHDLGESVIGDIPSFIGFQEDKKYKMEQNGVQYLESLLQSYSPENAAEILSLWEEHEEGKTPEAQWVREMDKFECLLQAHEYEQRTYGEKNLDEFQGQVAKVHSQEGKRANVEMELKTWKAPVKDFEADLDRSASYFEKVAGSYDQLCERSKKVMRILIEREKAE